MPRYLLVAGIDFGTSFTKIVLRDKNTPSAPAAVFHHPLHPNGLIPSLVGLDGPNIVPLAAPAPGIAVPYIKMVAAAVAEDGTFRGCGVTLPPGVSHLAKEGITERMVARALLAAYFVHLTAAIRDFIRGDRRWRDFDFSTTGASDALVHQLAVPSGLLSEGARAERLFRESLIAAFELRSQLTKPFVQSLPAAEWINAVNRVLDLPAPELVEKYKWQALVYPEVAAAVQPFFRSPNAIDGLYLTVDVGAGTIDCNAFRRRTSDRGPRKIDYYAALVAPLGVQHLKDPHGAVRLRSEQELFSDFQKIVRRLFAFACTKQPNNRYSAYRSTWDEAHIFIFGGGAHHPGYKEAFRHALLDCDFRTPRMRELPAPADLTIPVKTNFGRFAVAYGMSFFRPDLDEVRMPHQISTFRRAYPRAKSQNWDD